MARHINFDLPRLYIVAAVHRDQFSLRSFATSTIGRGADLNFIALRLQWWLSWYLTYRNFELWQDGDNRAGICFVALLRPICSWNLTARAWTKISIQTKKSPKSPFKIFLRNLRIAKIVTPNFVFIGEIAAVLSLRYKVGPIFYFYV